MQKKHVGNLKMISFYQNNLWLSFLSTSELNPISLMFYLIKIKNSGHLQNINHCTTMPNTGTDIQLMLESYLNHDAQRAGKYTVPNSNV